MQPPVGVLLWLVLQGAFFSATSYPQQPQREDVCGGSVNSTEAHLVVPGYPAGAPLYCDWAVEPVSASVCGLLLDLGSLSLPPCPSSQLTVAGVPVCGAHQGTVRVPFHRPVTLISYRGAFGGGQRFNMTVRQLNCKELSPSSWCRGEFSGDNIVILSPGYPNSYPKDVDCRYTIWPTDSGICQVEVTFKDSAIERSDNCSKDSLQIEEDKLCGDLVGSRTYPITERLDISFKTDSEGTSKGFQLLAREIRCSDTDVIIDASNENDKQDTSSDCTPLVQEGYPYPSPPFPSFPLPGNVNDQFPSGGYLPPSDGNNQITPIEQAPPLIPPFRQQFPSPCDFCRTVQPQISTDSPFINKPTQDNIVLLLPPNSRPEVVPLPFLLPPYSPLQSRVPFVPPSTQSPQYLRPNSVMVYNGNQCCGQTYSDNRFLLVSPGFPRSVSSNCIYTIERFSPFTFQLRLQFRYFWAGEDTGTGCSGGYLEIDGVRVCGCKTGLTRTVQFFNSETSKTLHLRLESTTDKPFNGFVIDVFQDEAYSQRYKRSGDTPSTFGVNKQLRSDKFANFSQYKETVVERNSLPLNGGEAYIVSQPPEQLLLDPSSLCLRWNLQDWLLLAAEALWARYQCPATPSSVDVTGSDVTRSAACQTCHYFCRQNCRCC